MVDNFWFVALPEAGHQQDAAANPGLAQVEAAGGGSYAKPARAFGLQGAGAFSRTVAVGIGLDHGANLNSLPGQFPEGAEIAPQRTQRNFRPVGTSIMHDD